MGTALISGASEAYLQFSGGALGRRHHDARSRQPPTLVRPQARSNIGTAGAAETKSGGVTYMLVYISFSDGTGQSFVVSCRESGLSTIRNSFSHQTHIYLRRRTKGHQALFCPSIFNSFPAPQGQPLSQCSGTSDTAS